MKVVESFLAGVFMVSMFLVIIISSVELAVYADYDYFREEFEKYNVNNKEGIVNMEMDELVRVTKEMMSYLRGDRDTLVIDAVIDGQVKEFFNDREKSHMADVRDLFVAAIDVRAVASLMVVVSFVNLCMLLYMKDIKILLYNAYKTTLVVLAGAITGLVAWCLIDFTGAFYKFHALFFSDYEWLLDKRNSRLINILPEGFFVDTATRIVVIFIMLILIMGGLLLFAKKNKKLGGTYE